MGDLNADQLRARSKVHKKQCKEPITDDTTENRSSRIKATHKQANPSLNTQRHPLEIRRGTRNTNRGRKSPKKHKINGQLHEEN